MLSNTPPTNPYRSAGRPEAMFVIERLIDLAARDSFGQDRIKLRRRNLVPAAAQPYANPLGMTYDSGDYEKAMDRALALADWDGFRQRRREAKRRGKLRGIGLANYIEATSGAPREYARITVQPEGRIDVVIGTLSSGQGHETSFAQCVAEWLGAPVEARPPDPGRHRRGSGRRRLPFRPLDAHGQRSSWATPPTRSSRKGRRSPPMCWRPTQPTSHSPTAASPSQGTDRSIGLFEVAAAARTRNDLPEDLRGPLRAESDQMIRIAAFPFGCHVCEVEVDPETGLVELARYTAVDDVGRAVNPLILHGQTHGALVQGVGQALWEHCHYEPTSGQALAGSFMDYALPRADMLPSFTTEISETPSPSHPYGIRAGGEGGTTPALAVVVNAVVDALKDYGVTHLEMPVTPERVWRAIRQGYTGRKSLVVSTVGSCPLGGPMKSLAAILVAGAAWIGGQRPPRRRPGRRARSRWWSRSRRAAAPMRWRGSWRRRWAPASVSRSWSRTVPAPPVRSAPPTWRRPRPTAIRC